jgi:hypothetical protein
VEAAEDQNAFLPHNVVDNVGKVLHRRSPYVAVHAREDLRIRNQDAKDIPDAGSESIP